MALVIDALRCPQNHRCSLVDLCPAGAIAQQGEALPVIDAAKCIECGLCADRCGRQAIDKK